MTSDERREMAEQLRKHNGRYYEELVNMSDSDLADLIDPTCHVSDEEVTHQPTLNAMVVHVYTCDRCSSPFYMGDVCTHPKPLYCPYCGARLVSDDG